MPPPLSIQWEPEQGQMEERGFRFCTGLGEQ